MGPKPARWSFAAAHATPRGRRTCGDLCLRWGDWCPGYHERPGRPAHPSADLTADHAGMVGLGHPESGPLVVRCRSCNSARAAAIMARELRGSPMSATAAPPRQTNSRLLSAVDDDGPVVA